MFLQKYQNKFSTPKFYFDAAHLMDALTLFYYKQTNDKYDGNLTSEVKYIVNDTVQVKDIENIKILKEELGTDFIEKQMYKQFTRNNNTGEDEIKNKFKKNLYTDLQKQNNFLASIFLYFFHKYYYYDENVDQINDITKLKNFDDSIAIYKNLKTNGLPSAKIIDEIKSVYPYIHNLFIKLLEIKYGQQANIALMNIQDASEALKDAELNGQIAKIKVKKHSKLELAQK